MKRALGGLLACSLLVAAACALAPAARAADEAPCAPAEPSPQEVVACLPGWDRFVAGREKAREDYPLTFQVGAIHWVNVNRETGKATYGYPGAEGTFTWWGIAEVNGPSFGAHVEARFRERTKYAAYYDGRFWLQEAYLWADALGGRFKAGKVQGVFGLETDGTWWGTLPYYDGFQYDPDWGISYERDLVAAPCVSLKGTAQVFFAEDHVNSSAVGGDAESDPDRKEKPSAILRVAPSWKLSGAKLEVGVSGLLQRIEGAGVPDDTVVGGALDATLELGGFTARAAAYLVDGVRNGAHYVTGGPSARIEDVVLVLERPLGPVTLRACWSGGWIHDPGGTQSLWILGGNVAVVRNVDLYLEYVHWTTQIDGEDARTYEDSFQIVVQWRF